MKIMLVYPNKLTAEFGPVSDDCPLRALFPPTVIQSPAKVNVKKI